MNPVWNEKKNFLQWLQTVLMRRLKRAKKSRMPTFLTSTQRRTSSKSSKTWREWGPIIYTLWRTYRSSTKALRTKHRFGSVFLIFHEQYLSTSRGSPALASNAMQINAYLVRETSWVEHLVVVYVPLLEILLLLLIHVFFKNLFALF